MNFGLLSDGYAPVVSHSTSNIMTLTHSYRAVYNLAPCLISLRSNHTTFSALEHTDLRPFRKPLPPYKLHVGKNKKKLACVDPYY